MHVNFAEDIMILRFLKFYHFICMLAAFFSLLLSVTQVEFYKTLSFLGISD